MPWNKPGSYRLHKAAIKCWWKLSVISHPWIYQENRSTAGIKGNYYTLPIWTYPGAVPKAVGWRSYISRLLYVCVDCGSEHTRGGQSEGRISSLSCKCLGAGTEGNDTAHKHSSDFPRCPTDRACNCQVLYGCSWSDKAEHVCNQMQK